MPLAVRRVSFRSMICTWDDQPLLVSPLYGTRIIPASSRTENAFSSQFASVLRMADAQETHGR